jgi:asparagine synthase (glutamine-hydrolysing)
MASACPSEADGRATSVAAAIEAARAQAGRAPFLWLSSGDPPQARGLQSFHAAADGGATYVRWHWDGQRLEIDTDSFGFIPAYVYTRGREAAVSTSVERLIGAGARLRIDRAALAVFLRLGFFVGEDTPFVEIRALPPDAHVVWQDGRLSTSGAPYVVPAARIARHDAINRAIELTAMAVERRRGSLDVAIPLSGGRDSRHILLALAASGHAPSFAVTVPRCPPTAAEDERIAALVAMHLHVPHVVVSQSREPAAAEARKNIATNYCADEHAWFFPMIDYVNEHAGGTFEGIGGSLWTTGWLPDRESREAWRQGRFEEVARRILDRYSTTGEAFLAKLLDGDRTSAAAEERLALEVARHAQAADPGKSFHFWNRLRRELALIPFGELRRSGEVYTPLVDRDVVDFLLSLQPEVVSPRLSRADKSFHTEAIRRAFPHAAGIPFESEDAPHTDARAHDRALTTGVARYLLTRGTPPALMRRTYIWPRAAYTLINPRYAEGSRWLATASLYLSQIEEALQ